jgi:hypothetical protein
MRFKTTILVLLYTVLCFSQAKKDTLFFVNKTMMVGELQKISQGKVEFDCDDAGIVNVKYHVLKTIEAQTHFYRIEMINHRVLLGYVKRSDTKGTAIISSAKGVEEIKLANIASLTFYEKSWIKGLKGNVGAGYTYTKSEKIGRLNIEGNLKYAKEKVETKLSGTMILTKDSTHTYREKEDLELVGSLLTNTRWYSSINGHYQRSLELGLLSRWQEGIGEGYKFLQRQHSTAKAITGFVVNQEYDLEKNHNTYVEWALRGSYNFFSFSKPNVTFSINQSYYVSLSQKGRRRNDGEVECEWELIDDFSLSLSFYHNYDRKSPGTNTPELDYGFVSGLNYRF